MEILRLIIMVVGFVALGLYQRYCIKALKTQVEAQQSLLSTQNKAIESLKMYVEIFNPEKIKEFVKMRETTFDDFKNKEINRVTEEMHEQSKTARDAMTLLIKEYAAALDIIFDSLYYLPINLRYSIANKASNSITKTNLSKNASRFPYYGDQFVAALENAMMPVEDRKGQPSENKG